MRNENESQLRAARTLLVRRVPKWAILRFWILAFTLGSLGILAVLKHLFSGPQVLADPNGGDAMATVLIGGPALLLAISLAAIGAMITHMNVETLGLGWRIVGFSAIGICAIVSLLFCMALRPFVWVA